MQATRDNNAASGHDYACCRAIYRCRPYFFLELTTY